MKISVQTKDFDAGAELAQMRLAHPEVGALVSFVGQVRDLNDGAMVSGMHLEHYPGMTEKALEDIISQAKTRWDIYQALVIHRVGPLLPEDQIVFVAVTSAHRGEAFAGAYVRRHAHNSGREFVDERAARL